MFMVHFSTVSFTFTVIDNRIFLKDPHETFA